MGGWWCGGFILSSTLSSIPFECGNFHGALFSFFKILSQYLYEYLSILLSMREHTTQIGTQSFALKSFCTKIDFFGFFSFLSIEIAVCFTHFLHSFQLFHNFFFFFWFLFQFHSLLSDSFPMQTIERHIFFVLLFSVRINSQSFKMIA